jgi:hypothetical protein
VFDVLSSKGVSGESSIVRVRKAVPTFMLHFVALLADKPFSVRRRLLEDPAPILG